MIRLTSAALRSRRPDLLIFDGVASRLELRSIGIGDAEIAAQLAAGRWSTFGSAIILHNGELTPRQRQRAALINCGPRSALTSFTSTERWGLKTWHRDEVHVLAPGGARDPKLPGVVLHRTRDWGRADVVEARQLHRFAPAAVLAASSFAKPRLACGLLAAGVQQRLVRVADLRAALDAAPRTRHRHEMLVAVDDIEGGAHALSEIDFATLCRTAGLMPPVRQAVRLDTTGRRRYLDAEWVLPDGTRIAVEVDGALHLAPMHWWDDQLRQNELVIAGTKVLRFPSAVVRHEPDLVIDQLRRILGAATA